MNMSTERWKRDDAEIGEKKRKLSTNEKSGSNIAPNKKFRFSEHAEKTLEIFESYFNDKLLTDVTLVTNTKCIDAHRMVLSASSQYFAKIFKSTPKELIPDEIEMKEIDGDALLALVQYCYTGCIDVQKETEDILFTTAHLLQIDPVVEACKEFLIKRLDPGNCLGIKTLADTRGCDKLSSIAHAYALENFVQVVRNQEFLSISADRVAELLVSEDVNVPSEETIFNALETWLKHDSTNRIKDASKLLSYVKLPLLTSEFIAVHIQGNELFNGQKAIQDSILEAFTYHLLRKPTDSLLKSGRTRPRKSTVDILLALGEIYEKEFDEDVSSSLPIDAFDLRKNTWTNFTMMKFRGETYDAVCSEERLFVVGGKSSKTPTKAVVTFNFSNKSWDNWPEMNTSRNRGGVAVLNEFLYAVGGYNNITNLNTVERCDLTSKKWSFVAPMSTERSDAGVAVLNNKLYVVGGWNGEHDLNTMECYDPKTNKWIFCSPMSQACDQVGVGVLNGYLYVLGGSNDKENLNSVERYDPNTNTWTMVASMSISRRKCGVAVLGNQLLAVGGFGNDGRRLTSVEAYDPAVNDWQRLAPLKKGRAGPCVVVDRTICKL